MSLALWVVTCHLVQCPIGGGQLPSEMDEKGVSLEGKRVCDFVRGWVRELWMTMLCKAEPSGKLFPLPVDSLLDHPEFRSLGGDVREVWFGLMSGLNLLYGVEARGPGKVSRVRLKACMFLAEEAKGMLVRCHTFGKLNWQDYLKVRTIDYKGDEVKVAQETTWTNIAPALPDEVGTVPLINVVTKGSWHYVTHFKEYLLPEAEQVRVKAPRVMVPDSEWEALARGLLEKGICGLIRESEVHHIQGKPLFNGLFGVPKDEVSGSAQYTGS